MKYSYLFMLSIFAEFQLNAMQSRLLQHLRPALQILKNVRIKSNLVIQPQKSKFLALGSACAIIAYSAENQKDGGEAQAEKETFENSMILQAAGPNPIDKNHPYSVTPVKYGNDLLDLGDLAEFQESQDSLSKLAKQNILHGVYTKCSYYANKKTRLSRGMYKEVGLVIAGAKDNQKLCEKAHFSHMAQYLKEVQDWKKKNNKEQSK